MEIKPRRERQDVLLLLLFRSFSSLAGRSYGQS